MGTCSRTESIRWTQSCPRTGGGLHAGGEHNAPARCGSRREFVRIVAYTFGGSTIPRRIIMQKWEYKIVYIRDLKERDLEVNRLGEQGWEMVAVDHKNNTYYFKRPKS